jgi:hypothetical protein
MRFVIAPEAGLWTVSLPEDSEPLMLAEILSLEEVSLYGGTIRAHIRAVWGATRLRDYVMDHPHLIRKLGIGRPFSGGSGLLPLYLEEGNFFCGETNQVLYHVPLAFLTRGRMYYSPEYRRKQERRNHQ